MDSVVNLRLLSHPINWVFVWVTLALACMAWTAVHNAWQAQTSISPD